MEVNMKKSFKAYFDSKNCLAFLCVLALVLSTSFVFVGCDNNNGEAANITEMSAKNCVSFLKNSTDLALDETYSYTGSYGTEKFTITSKGIATYDTGFGEISGSLCCVFKPTGYDGFIIFIKTTEHSNYGHYQYPNYNEENPHTGCYMAYYLSDITENSLSFASSVFNVEEAPEVYAACADSFENLKKLFVTYGYEETCSGYATKASRSKISNRKIFYLAK